VQCDRLKTNEVVSAGDRRRNRSRPGRVLVNHLPAAPISVEDSPANESGLIDFELILGQELVVKNEPRNTHPLERLCADASACRSGTLGQICQLA
jgi:hypothetical protein